MEKKILCEAPDISQHQGTVNFKAVRDAGYPAVFLRAGYGKNNVDQKYIYNARACVNLGIPVMTYWFMYPLNAEMAKTEAKYAIAQTKKFWEQCPIAADLEYDSIRYAATRGVKIDKKLATDMVIAFLKEVKSAGYTPVLYTNRDYRKNYFDLMRIKKEVGGKVLIWYALYNKSIPLAEMEISDVWQYTSKGKISGVSGNVDLNKVYYKLFKNQQIADTEHSEKKNIRIMEFQQAANADGYRDQNGEKLDEDGIDGAKTQYVRRKIALQAKRVKVLWVERSTGKVVEWLQERLCEVLGTGLEITGEYDNETRKAVGQYQEKYNLTKDYVAGYNTIQSLFYN